jgi:4-aminobutyrate aminotransferase / (S)-3-amino-2-methylpropionate transaminase / 5-aminovalerate transaminase
LTNNRADSSANGFAIVTEEISMTLNTDLWSRRTAAIARGVASTHQIFPMHANNAEVWDVEGKRYIDFAGGIGVLNTGHCHPKVVEAVTAQLERYTHTAFQVLPYEPYVTLAEKLNVLAPGDAPKKTLLMTTGAEAVENAVKIARAYTKRSALIAFSGGFHGRTMMGLALTGKVEPYKALGPTRPRFTTHRSRSRCTG